MKLLLFLKRCLEFILTGSTVSTYLQLLCFSTFFDYFLDHTRFSVRENMVIENVEETIEELKLFKAAGGSTIVDVSPIRLRRVSL